MTTKTRTISFRQAFEAEQLRRDAERHDREEAERRQQEADFARADQLHDALSSDPAFLAEKGLTLERTRYTILLHHEDFRIRAYFEAGQCEITASDKRNALPGGASPRKQETVDSVEDAVIVIAQFLADETH